LGFVCLFIVFGLGIYLAVFRVSANSSLTQSPAQTAAKNVDQNQTASASVTDAELLKTASLPLLLKMSTKIDGSIALPSASRDSEPNLSSSPTKSVNTVELNTQSKSIDAGANSAVVAMPPERVAPVIAEVRRADGTAVDLGNSGRVSTEQSIKLDAKQANSTSTSKSNANVEKAPETQGTFIKEVSPQQRAEGEFKQATIYQQQGRVSEAVQSLEQALKLDQNHAPARQLMISLLLESKRYDEAIRELRTGLANDSHQINFAMILARLLVERAKVNEAVDILQKGAPFAQDRPDYLAFMAALQQKLGHHKEAIQSYRLALSRHTQNAAWWMGYGISLQAEGANTEALEAYRQAKTQPGLGADLIAFIDQKIAQIQK
jgi:MSHA biogenesis protein MshN